MDRRHLSPCLNAWGSHSPPLEPGPCQCVDDVENHCFRVAAELYQQPRCFRELAGNTDCRAGIHKTSNAFNSTNMN